MVARGEEPEAQKSWYRQNEVTLVLTGISNVYPNFFDMIGKPRSARRGSKVGPAKGHALQSRSPAEEGVASLSRKADESRQRRLFAGVCYWECHRNVPMLRGGRGRIQGLRRLLLTVRRKSSRKSQATFRQTQFEDGRCSARLGAEDFPTWRKAQNELTLTDSNVEEIDSRAYTTT